MAEGELVPDGSQTDKNREDGIVRIETNTTLESVIQDMVAAAGFNVKSPILNAVIQNLTKLSSEETIQENPPERHCPICDISYNNTDGDMLHHILGKKHKNKMWSLRINKNLKRVCNKKTLTDPAKGEYICPLCKVTANSPIQLVTHLRSKRHNTHKTITGIELSANPIDDLSGPVVTYFCKHCEIHLNSHKKMLKHRTSSIHKINIERNRMMREAMRFCW